MMMAKVALLLVLFYLAPPCSAQTTVLQVVTELSPPHQIVENGEVAGLSTELVKSILTEADIEGQFQIYPWARALHIAMRQPNVLIYNMARTAEREAQFNWIGEIAFYQLGFVKLTHRTDIHIQSLKDALQYRIAVQREDLSANFLLKQGFEDGKQLVLVTDIAESWQLLINNKVDLVIDDAKALKGMAKTLNFPSEYVQFEFAIAELEQRTWLAASINTPGQTVQRLQQAHAKIATSKRFEQIMAAQYE